MTKKIGFPFKGADLNKGELKATAAEMKDYFDRGGKINCLRPEVPQVVLQRCVESRPYVNRINFVPDIPDTDHKNKSKS